MGNLCSGQKVENQAVEETSRQSTGVDFQGQETAKGDRNEAIAERRRKYPLFQQNIFYFTISATKGAGLLGKTDWSDEEDEEESADQPAKPEAPEESQVQDEQTPVEPGVENENAEQAPVAEEAPVQQGRLSVF